MIRTDSGESGLRDLVSIQRRATADQHPVEWVADVLSVPFHTTGPPPRVVYLRCKLSCLVGGVCLISEVQYLLTRIAVKEENVYKVGLCDLRPSRVPCTDVRMLGRASGKALRTNKGNPFMLRDNGVGLRKTGDDLVSGVDLAVCHRLRYHPELITLQQRSGKILTNLSLVYHNLPPRGLGRACRGFIPDPPPFR